MARPRQFDETQALDKAMYVFWTKGYHATTPADLLEAMALSKSSFYATFGSKRVLFLRCIEHYTQYGCIYLRNQLGGRDIRTALRGMYAHMANGAAHPDRLCGCLIVNTAAELAQRDPEVAEYVGAGFDAFEKEFCRAFARARTEGQISIARTPRQLARYFLNTNIGLHVMHKTPGRERAASEIVKQALAKLD